MLVWKGLQWRLVLRIFDSFVEKHLNFMWVEPTFWMPLSIRKVINHHHCLHVWPPPHQTHLNIWISPLSASWRLGGGEDAVTSADCWATDYRLRCGDTLQSVKCRVSAPDCLLCVHTASSDHRPPVSEAFVAAARPEGAGRGGAGHLVSGTASHAASNIIIRSHEGGIRSCSAFRDTQRVLCVGSIKYLRLWRLGGPGTPHHQLVCWRPLEVWCGPGHSNTVRGVLGVECG